MRDECIEHIKGMEDGEEYHFNIFFESSALVRKEDSLYKLYEVPLYGGDPMFSGLYASEDISVLVDEALSWN